MPSYRIRPTLVNSHQIQALIVILLILNSCFVSAFPLPAPYELSIISNVRLQRRDTQNVDGPDISVGVIFASLCFIVASISGASIIYLARKRPAAEQDSPSRTPPQLHMSRRPSLPVLPVYKEMCQGSHVVLEIGPREEITPPQPPPPAFIAPV